MRGVSGREWIVLSDLIKPDEGLRNKFGDFLAQLLANRGMDEGFAELSLRSLPHYRLIPRLEEAVDRIARAVRRGERIILFGDYDVDGITSTAIIYDLIKRAGGKVYPVLPTRATGYGLNGELMETFSRYGDLLITLDNGTSAVEEIDSSPMDVVVIDHHKVPQEVPSKAILVNPKAYGDGTGDMADLSSAGMAFYIGAVLSRELSLEVDIRDYLDLVALGTVADLMNLSKVNRILVSKGLYLMNKVLEGSVRKEGLRALLEVSRISGNVTTKDIAFSLAPRLNAPGRVGDPRLSFEILLERDPHRATLLAKRIELMNRKRRAISEYIFLEAVKEARSKEKEGFITLWNDRWHPGVLGIVAGRLARLMGKPVAVFHRGKEISVGSVRSVEGVDVYEGLKGLSHMFLKWGGHSGAVGLTLRSEKLSQFSRLAQTVFKDIQIRTAPIYVDMWMSPDEITDRHVKEISMLEPFGEGNPYPSFVARIRVEKVWRDSYRTVITYGDRRIICWERDLFQHIKEGREMSILYTIMKGDMILEDLAVEDGGR